MTTEKEPPLFGSVMEALDFAFNASKVDMPQPYMNKAMAAAPVKVRKAKLSKNQKAVLVQEQENIKRMNLYPRAHLKGLDKAAQAGFIVAKVKLLDLEQVTVLQGLHTHAYDPCACRSPCCSGRRPNPRWEVAVKQMCHILKETGQVLASGKRGLSTQPDMRRLIVEEWFTGEPTSLARIARQFHLSNVTVASHKQWITGYLDQTREEAYAQIAPIFDQAGITGAIL